MKINFFFALSLVLFAACLVLDILDVIKCHKMGEEIGNRLMLECILHTLMLIILAALALND